MTKLTLMLIIALALTVAATVGCNKKSEPTPEPSKTMTKKAATPPQNTTVAPLTASAKAIAEIKAAADKMCACKDQACGKAVFSQFFAVVAKLRTVKLASPGEKVAVDAQTRRLMTCRSALK